MRTSIEPWLELDSVESTQTVAAERVRSGRDVGVVFAHNQTAGKGRLGRTWLSDTEDSLTFSLTFSDDAELDKPFLIGMACALAAASAVHSQVRWPNDLVIGDKKLGGILTELIPDPSGKLVPVVGIGINLNQRTFPPELLDIATSLALEHGGRYEAKRVAEQILNRIALLPELTDWSALAPIWELFDRTPGKRYRLPNGDSAIAVAVGSEGQLICSVDGESYTVLAAEALFGHEG